MSVAKAEPVCRWHVVQWQTKVRAGSRSTEYLTARHKQPPVNCAIDASDLS
jgi:hypothetical protein